MKYVYVYDYNPSFIYYGYLPGYVGFYCNNGVIVYGTGYRYSSWWGSYYYPYPMTYGFGIYYYDWHHHCHSGTSYHTYHSHYKDWHGPRGSLSIRYNHSDYTKYYNGHRQSWREFETRVEGPNGRMISNRESYISERGDDLYARSDRSTNFQGKDRSLDTNVKRRLDTNGRGDGTLEMERRRNFDGKNRDIVSDTERKLSVNDGKKELDVNKNIKVTDKDGNTKYYEINKNFDGSNRYNNSKKRTELKDRYQRNLSQRNNVYSDRKRNIYKRDIDGWKKRQNNTWQSVNRKNNSNISNLNRQFSSRAKAQYRSSSSRKSSYRSSGSFRRSGSSGRSFRRK